MESPCVPNNTSLIRAVAWFGVKVFFLRYTACLNGIGMWPGALGLPGVAPFTSKFQISSGKFLALSLGTTRARSVGSSREYV